MKNKKRQILFSIIFAILFSIMLFTELFNFVNFINTGDIFNLCLSFMAIVVSGVGMYVSIIWGVVRLLYKESKSSGGEKNGKKETKEN